MDQLTLRHLDNRERKLLAQIDALSTQLVGVRAARSALLSIQAPALSTSRRKRSIPRMVEDALRQQYINGATLGQLFSFIKERRGRDVSRSYLSVTLSHMKRAGKLARNNQMWTIT